ncbi:MAG: RNA polymerase sigma factor [Candidatus Thiodiazotropha sp. (ex Dulcina madagascariensis)]|nr:RNA polymerase sigma factor [Candidatus Thiodiazotropha sp. (ex Dulcina madagascariensis)]MCU7927190.1 RNA polymerase sigma factor [Candidatus Thiodiazotropha sp. (ex Dulcina madagascariensis)]
MKQTNDMRELLRRGYRYAFSLTHDKTRAEDLLQDAWVSTLKTGGVLRRAYLFSAIRSRFLDSCRRAQLVVFESLDEEVDAGQQHTPADEIVLANLQMLERSLSTLRPIEREVLLLSDLEGYTAQEISELTGHPRGTVLSLIHRSRRRLKHYLCILGEEVQNAERAVE